MSHSGKFYDACACRNITYCFAAAIILIYNESKLDLNIEGIEEMGRFEQKPLRVLPPHYPTVAVVFNVSVKHTGKS
jgi:hypothetical protein